MPTEGLQSGIFSGFYMTLPYKIPISVQIMGDEYNVDNESVTTLLHLQLE